MELIEREQQLQVLADAWKQVKTGRGRLVLVSGEAGIGKTSLVDAFVAKQRRETTVLWGACDDLFSPKPLGPFTEIAVQTESDLLRFIRSGADRLAIATELFLYLQKSAAPLILVLEDLHWADEATLDVVKFLGRRIQHTKTLMILTYRYDEVSTKHPLSLLLGDLPALHTGRITLPLLSADAVDHLAQQSGRQWEGLYHVTGGNPFFVTEIIASDSEGVPPSVRDAVLTRVARLSPAAKTIVELSSLLPGEAETWLIDTILQPNSTALDECVECGILRSSGNALRFRHELARQAVEDSLPIGRARDLHGKILAALLGREAEPDSLPRLVHHAARAGDEEAILQFALPAAQQASDLGAHRQAAALYQTALPFAHRLPLEAQAELLEGLSFDSYQIDRIEAALQAREQAILLWQRLERMERVGDCQRWLSRLHWSAGNRQEAEQYANLAIETLSALPAGSALAMAFSNKSQLHMLAWEPEPAIEWGNRAIALAEQLDNPEIIAHALTNVGSTQFLFSYETGREKIERAVHLALEHQLYEHVCRCYANIGSYCVQAREYAEAEQWLQEGLAYITARDLDFQSVYLLGWQARLYFETGRWAEAEEIALEATHLAKYKTITPITSLITLGHLKVRQGDPAAAAFLDQALDLSLPTGEIQRLGPLAAARAEAAWQRGDVAQVLAETSAAYELALQRYFPWQLGQLAYWMWRGGYGDVPLDKLARPFALMIQGAWRAAAFEWARIGCPYEQAMALAEGDVQAKMEALAIWERLGARPAAERLRAELQAQGITGIPGKERKSRQTYAAGLTAREIEVLQLMAAGLSNPLIAEKLIISIGTVKAHTGTIYSKLGVHNRVQAVARARDLNLLSS